MDSHAVLETNVKLFVALHNAHYIMTNLMLSQDFLQLS